MVPWVVLIFLQDGGFFVKTKEKLEIQKQPKLIGQTKMSDYKLWVVDTFQKGMSLAKRLLTNFATKQQLWKFINSKRL